MQNIINKSFTPGDSVIVEKSQYTFLQYAGYKKVDDETIATQAVVYNGFFAYIVGIDEVTTVEHYDNSN